MLTELHIARLGVIDDATLELGPGFTAVTGETGAGKTMVVSGLGLLLGDKAGNRLIRHGAPQALVEGRLRVDEQLDAAVAELGGAVDDGDVILTRIVTPSRSRAQVGGVQVPLTALSRTVGERITVHGQAGQLRLGTPERQRQMLDAFAGGEFGSILDGYRRDFARYRACTAERESLLRESQARARELAMLEFGLAEIAKADPRPREDEDLLAEARKLQAVDDLRASARRAIVALAGDDETFPEEPNALGLVATARTMVEAIAGDDPQVAPLASRVCEAGYLLSDAAGELASYLGGLDADPNRLEWIAGRLSELQGLTRRYGETIDEVLAWGERAARDAATLSGSDDRIAELTATLHDLDASLRARAERMTELRTVAAVELAERVERELAALAMPRARLRFEIAALPGLAAHGRDQVTLLFSANPGSPPAPLAKVASGGELSRLRLGLEVVLASSSDGHTFVFDEVDAGVGGAVALEIGRRLARLARHAQVLVVTHLAQVAAFADHQFVVEKADDGQVTRSGIRSVTGDARVDELARMMAGLDGSAASRAHAEELLRAAAGDR